MGGEGGIRIPNGGTPDSGTERDAPQVQGSGGGRADAQTIVRADASVLCDAGAAGCSGQCPAMTHNCGGLCASNAGVNSCGATSCDPCTAPTNAMARCTAGACAWDCLPGFVKCGAACLTGTCCGDPDCKSTNPTFVCLNNKCGPPPDTKSPVVASVTPGVQGVPKDANLVVTFSEAMNRQKTEAAFAGPSLGPVKFSWSVADTVLTINPDADLSYAEGANPLAVTATPYSFTITSGATDVAGNPLPAYSYTFTTLRRISTRLRSASDTNLDGFAVANGSDDHPYDSHMAVGYSSDSIMKGFATIDLTALPGGITRFESALLGVWQNNLYGPDMSRVGSIQVEHVRFVTINAAAVNAARLRPLGVLSTNITSEWKERDVSAALQDDYADRQARLNRSQYRIFPEKATTGNFYIGYGTTEAGESYEPRITVVYLLP